jgi:phage head maturation protease
MDEVVVPEGCEIGPNGQPAYLSDAKSIFLNHDYGMPIGTVRNCRLTGGRWVCQFALHGVTETARDVRALFDLGDDNPVRGVSIGFVRKSGGQPTKDEVQRYGPAGYVTREWLWMELSVTPQPCNPEAWVMSAGKAVPRIDDRTAGRLDDLARKGVIGIQTARSMGLVEPKRRKVIIIDE